MPPSARHSVAVQAARRRLLAILGRRVPPPRLAAEEWSVVVDEAIRHRAAPLLYRRLREYGAMDLPANTLQRLRDVYTVAALRSAHMMRELSTVLGALEQRGIETMALKGAALALAVYPEPALRSMADLDVLVPRARLADAERALLDIGYGSEPRPDIETYTSWCHHIAPLERDGSYVEVHWTIERPSSPFDIDLDALWRRASRVETGPRTLVPAPEDMLLHTCIHGAYHHRLERSAFKHLFDVAAIIERYGDRIDWSRLARIARETGASAFVRCTLLLAEDLLGVPLPTEALAGMPRAPGEDKLVRAARNYILAPPEPLPSAYDELARRRGLASRLRLVAETLFPGRSVITALHGLPAGSPRWVLYAALRPVDLLLRRGRIGVQILFRSNALRPALQREADRRRIYRWVDDADATRGPTGQA